MTWEQFAAVVLGVVATALVRLLDKYLPRPADRPTPALAEGMAGPPRASTSPPASTPTPSEPPPEGYQPPQPPHGPQNAS